MTDDEKKALIVAGSIAVIGFAVYMLRGGTQTLLNNGVQPAPVAASSTPGYTSYNVPPYAGQSNSTIYPPSPAAQSVMGGCGCDSCASAGGINGGNAPTSLTQLLNWYGQTNPDLLSQLNAQTSAFSGQPVTIMEMTSPPLSVSNVPF